MEEKAVEEQAKELKALINRLRRAHGQLGAVIAMVEEKRDCREIVMQLSAVSKAIDRAGFKIIATQMKGCAAGTQSSEDPDEDELEQLFMKLV